MGQVKLQSADLLLIASGEGFLGKTFFLSKMKKRESGYIFVSIRVFFRSGSKGIFGLLVVRGVGKV